MLSNNKKEKLSQAHKIKKLPTHEEHITFTKISGARNRDEIRFRATI